MLCGNVIIAAIGFLSRFQPLYFCFSESPRQHVWIMSEQSLNTCCVLFCLSSSEPERVFLRVGRQQLRHGRSGEVSDARLPGSLPHLPVCGVCVQPGGSHGPDSLCHHPHQVFSTPARSGSFLDPAGKRRHSVDLCFPFRTVSPELKSYALGVLFLLLRLLGENILANNTFGFYSAKSRQCCLR